MANPLPASPGAADAPPIAQQPAEPVPAAIRGAIAMHQRNQRCGFAVWRSNRADVEVVARLLHAPSV